ncbi:MAG: carboxylesterase family protein [Bacteroidota bacterium]
MKKYFLLSCSLLVIVFFTANSQKVAQLSEVTIANGTLAGTIGTNGVRSFKGIPFAAPPIGELRWKEPQPVANWTGVKEAIAFGPRAMQAPIFGDMNFRSNGVSENCLYLNVWTPAKSANQKLPVLVYFYGGGFVAGDGSEPRYDGESMATKGIVAITVNYRLGLFGFLAHPELTKESPHKASGNYGVLDQSAALRWVQQNISAFGGDPARVTIAGESAGSASVSAQMASPLSKNLIAGAIGESGSVLGTLPAIPLQLAEQNGLNFAKAIGATSLTELRKMNADTLLNASMKSGPFRFSMTVDGYFFPKSPYAIYESGEQAHVPLLAGWNSQESDFHAILGNEKPTIENYKKALQKLYADSAERVFHLYHPTSNEAVEGVATELASDRFIGFSTWKWADIQSKTGGQPVYRYMYNRPRPVMTPEMGNATAGLAGGVQRNTGNTPPEPPAKGAVHSAEIEYAMGNLSTNKVFAWTQDDYKVSETMQEYFANFIKKGDPNGKGLPEWPAINNVAPLPVMHIDVNTKLLSETNRERYLYFDKTARK